MSLPDFPAKTDKPLTALGFDFGTQRIGLAFGQSISGSARAVAVIRAKDGIPDWELLGRHIEQWHPDVFVVGLPYNMDGSESELLQRAMKFARRLHGRYHRPVFGMDERLSSREAIEQVLEQHGSKDRAIDDIAAQIILENWFNGLSARAQSDAGQA